MISYENFNPCGWPMRRFLFLFLLSISGIPKFVNIKKNTKKLKNGPCQHKTGQKNNKKNDKIKNTKIKIKCVGGTNLLYLLCLISNTMPQLEQSSLQPSTVLHPPSTDHQLQPSPSTPPPHLQKRKTQAAPG